VHIDDKAFSPLVKALVEDPDRVPKIYYLGGLLGRTNSPDYVRLYLPSDDGSPTAPFFADWVDIKVSVVLHVEVEPPSPTTPNGWTGLWIDAAALTKHGSFVLDKEGNPIHFSQIGESSRPVRVPWPVARREPATPLAATDEADPSGGTGGTSSSSLFPGWRRCPR